MNVLILIVLSILGIMACGVWFGIGVQYDALTNWGSISIKIFGVPIFNKNFTIYASAIELITNTKVVRIKLSFSSSDFIILRQILVKILQKIYIQKLIIDANLGFNSASTTSIVAGNTSIMLNILHWYIYCKSNDTIVRYSVNPIYTNYSAHFTINTNVVINIYDIVWSIILIASKRSLYGNKNR